MSRPLRIEYPGAFYHVMNRGLNRNPIFFDEDNDRALFKKTIGEAVDRWKMRVHAFALMNNHYHLLVETPLANLSRAMRHIDGVYTQRFNRRHRRDGPLLRGRFKSILVEKESYFLELVRYIHLNGVKAKIAPSPKMDFYSSHWDYSHPHQATPWLEQSLVLSHFRNSKLSSIEELDQFVRQGIPIELEKILSRRKWPAILGAKSFIVSAREKYLCNRAKHPEIPEKTKLLRTRAIHPEKVLKIVSEIYVPLSLIPLEKTNIEREARWAQMYFLQRYSFLNFREIGEWMNGISYKAVQKFLQRNDFRNRGTVLKLERFFEKNQMSHVAT